MPIRSCARSSAIDIHSLFVSKSKISLQICNQQNASEYLLNLRPGALLILATEARVFHTPVWS